MTTVSPAAEVLPRGTAGPRLTALARFELVRFARHPLLLVGAALCAFFTILALRQSAGTVDRMGAPVVALFLGVVSMLVADFLTGSTRRSKEVLSAAPTTDLARTAALCIACLAPVLYAAVWLVLYLTIGVRVWPVHAWLYGAFSHADVTAVLLGQTVVATAGAALLGVAAGRWLHFRGAAVALVVGVIGWVTASDGVFSAGGPAHGTDRVLRLFTPFTDFEVGQLNPDAVDSLTGSPWWYLAWLVTLSGLAATAALLKGARPVARRRLLVTGVILVAGAAVFYGLATFGGLDHVVRSYPDGNPSSLATPSR